MIHLPVRVLLAVVVAGVVALAAGGNLLLTRLPGGLPLGNAVAWLALLAAAAAGWKLRERGTRRRWLATAAAILAVLWFPTSAALAGNADLVFSGGRGEVWLGLTVLTGALVLASISAGLVRAARERHQSGAGL